MDEDVPLISLPDAVRQAGVTARTVRRWVAAGDVLSRYINGRLYVDLATLNRTEAATRQHGGKRRTWQTASDVIP